MLLSASRLPPKPCSAGVILAPSPNRPAVSLSDQHEADTTACVTPQTAIITGTRLLGETWLGRVSVVGRSP